MGTPSTTASDFDSCRGMTACAPLLAPSSGVLRARLLFGFASCALLIALALASVASAATQYVFVKQFPGVHSTPGPFAFGAVRAQGVAVSDYNGHIYVAHSTQGAVYDFESADDTVATKWTGTTTPAGSFGGGRLSVAVDNTSGAVYVADTTHKEIVKFDAAGNLISSFGDTSPTPNGQLSGVATPAGSFVPPTGFDGSFGIAVDQATHDLYVVDAGHEVIDVFDEGGSYIRQITAKPAGIYSSGGNEMSGIAVSAQTGNVFVSDSGPGLVFVFDALGNYMSTWNGKDLPNGHDSAIPSFGTEPENGFPGPSNSQPGQLPLASVDAKQRIVVTDGSFYASINTFDEAGNFVPPQLTANETETSNVTALAVDEATEYLYAAGYQVIKVYEPRRVPDLAINDADEVKSRSATLSGVVTPDGGAIVACHFEYIVEGLFRSNPDGNLWQGAEELPCQTNPPSSPPFNATTEVSAEATGLKPGRLYRLRLVASSATGSNVDIGLSFRTPGEYEHSTDLGTTGSGDGQLDGPRDVAVDDTTGDIYVADTGNHRVVKFNSAGSFVAAWGWGVGNGASENQVCTGGCQAGSPGGALGQLTEPLFIEVDNSSGPSAHSVYVTDGDDRTVLKFTPGGSLVAGWGEGGSISVGQEGPLGGITVTSNGSLLVLSMNSPYFWTEFGQDGAFRSKAAPFFFNKPSNTGIDVDAGETRYETTFEAGVFASNPGGAISPFFNEYRLYPAGYGDAAGSGGSLPTTGVAVDRRTGEVYVSQEDHIDHFRLRPGCVIKGQSICEPEDSFGLGDLVEARGLAFDQSGRRVLAADTAAERIVAFSLTPKPTVTTGDASLAASSATLHGTVEPAPGDSVTSCRFEYGATSEYELGDVPCSPGAPFSTGADVTAALSGLDPYQTYHYRVVAEGPSELPVYGEDRTFTLAGLLPSAEGGDAVGIGTTEATLTGLVNPNSGSTSYRFDYGTAAQYGSKTQVAGPIGEDNVDHPVSAEISGLAPGTTYHFRVVAINFAGVDYGPDRTFNTPDAPTILAFGVSATGTTTATASVSAVPGFSRTSISVEYGTTTAYGSTVVEPLGSDNRAHQVQLNLTGLASGTTYHARAVATNAFGTASSADLIFTTPLAQPNGPKKCRKGFVRRHGKCKKRRKHRHHHRHTHGHRGSGR